MDKQARKGSRLLVIALWCVLFLVARAAVAEGTLVCHVVTENGQPGVFFVQTDDRKEASEAALRARVASVNGHDKAQVVEVVQCVSYPKGRFSDSAMQAYLEDLPM